MGRSDKPKALPYQMWIAGDVVPSIRETGSYTFKHEQQAMTAGLMEGARIVLETAKIEGNQLAIALDKLYHSYTGRSVLKKGDIEFEAPTKHHLITPTDIASSTASQRVRLIKS